MKKNLITFFGTLAFIALIACSTTISEKEKTIKTTYDSTLIKNQLPNSITVDSNQVLKVALTSAYVKAIQDFIDALYQKDKTVFDTLFFIKRNNGEPDDFPDIQLPQSIKQTKLLLFTQQQADNHQQLYCKSSPCINLIGQIEKDNAEFIFVIFYPSYKHQYDCYISCKFNSVKKSYDIEKLTIEPQPHRD